jgi:hypothetical protein
MGYRFSTKELDCFTADAFLVIDEEVEKVKAKEHEKAQRKARSKGR